MTFYKMMPQPRLLSLLALLFCFTTSLAQRVTYSEPDRDDVRNTNYETVGKFNGNFLVYKSFRGQHKLTLFNNDMKVVDRYDMAFVPDRVINTEFIAYKDYAWFIYQYQRRNIVYCMAAKINALGHLEGEPIQLDTTEVSFNANNRLYSVINSDDKNLIMVFKINSRKEDKFVLGTYLFNKDLQLRARNRFHIDMPDRNDFLGEFALDNDGDLVFLQMAGTTARDNINKVNLVMLERNATDLKFTPLVLPKTYLDELHLKVNNATRQYLITSMYAKQRRGDILGLFALLYNKQSGAMTSKLNEFSPELREDGRGDNSVRGAFNDYFIQYMIMRKDGGFLLTAEAQYTTSRGNNGFNRWDFMFGNPMFTPMDYYMWSPYSFYSPFRTWGMNQQQTTRYFADNIGVFNFDSSAKIQWANVIRKSQFDDFTDNLLGYNVMNTGAELYFLFNQLERRQQILTAQSVDAEGKVTRNPTIRNMDTEYEFMPRYARQTGSRQVIVPCQFRNYVCFAKIDF